jgi:hypothetical protein
MTGAGFICRPGFAARGRAITLLIAAGFSSLAVAADFPLEFKKITPQEVMNFPGGYGSYFQLSTRKPAKIVREPKAASARPLYGELRAAGRAPGIVLRLDESKGTGRGYDQLIVDFNQNGDLTDEPLTGPASAQEKPTPRGVRFGLFGPLELAQNKAVAGGRPTYYAQTYIRDTPADSARTVISAGYVRLKAAWYLEASVDLAGVKKKVGVYDGDTSFRIGETPESRTYSSADRWYFNPADVFLVDANDDEVFAGDPLQTESAPFGPIVYLGNKPFSVSLGPGSSALRAAPSENIVEVQIQPQGAQVQNVTLAWERSPDAGWKLMRPNAQGGKILVPAGNYRLTGCALSAGEGAGQVMAAARQDLMKRPMEFAPGKPNVLKCGGPLTIKVTAERSSLQPSALLLREATPDAAYTLSINGEVLGGDGEVYSTFGKGEKFADDPPKPSFKVVDAAGKTLVSGNLEFG